MKYLLIFALLCLYSCFSADDYYKGVTIDPLEGYYTYISFTSEDSLALSASSQIRITCYAASNNVADVPATPIMDSVFTFSSLEDEYLMFFVEEDFQKVKYKSGEHDNYKYYFTYKFDLNSDDHVDANDIMQDFEAQEIIFFNHNSEPTQRLTVPVKSCHADWSEEF